VVVAYPGVDVMPYLSPLALALGVLGALPAVATPVPASAPVRHEVAA
jgi:energy-coupling factor transport system permease protein